MVIIMSKHRSLYLLLCVVAVLSVFYSLSFGAIDISFTTLINWFLQTIGFQSDIELIEARIIEELRLPRLILAFLAGAGLSLAGAVLQMVTRNPLADPYLFGISSGASFGAVLIIALLSGYGAVWLDQDLMQLGITGGAFIGSALSVLLVLAFAGNGLQIERMLLAGVAVSFMFAAATSLVLYQIDAQAVSALLFWTMGSFTRANWDNLGMPVFIVSLCLILFLGFSRQMRTALAGDENARSLGVEIHRLRISMLLLSSLMTAVLVANSGGIGFVGLMIPHIIRRVFQRFSRFFFFSCALFGGCFMVWIDVLARTLMGDQELPIGIITAAIGSFFFLVVLRQRNRRI
jgi:iron complex transport system permease protein